MARTKLVPNKEENDLSNLKISDLKKLMEEKGIEGRSKVTKKADMIELIQLYEKNPDKDEIKKFIASKTKAPESKELKQETEPEKQLEPKEQHEECDLKHEYQDELLKQVIILSKKIGKNIKLCAHQSLEDSDFKKKWLKELFQINQRIENIKDSIESSSVSQ